MNELPGLPAWGVVPEPIRRILQRLKERAAEGVDAMDTANLVGETPQSHDEAFLRMSWAAEAADRATRDYRSIFNAYTHKFHQPRPPIGELAAMQGAITQSFAKRYTMKTVAAIETLLSPVPDLEVLRSGIRALGSDDLHGISDGLDAVLAQAASDPKFHGWLPSADKARATSRAIEEHRDSQL